MALCGACCAGDEGKGEFAPVETKKAGVGFNAPLDQALGGPGSMREEEAVVDASKRQEEPPPPEPAAKTSVAPIALPPAAMVLDQVEVAAGLKIRPPEVFNVQIPKGDRRMCLDINFHDHRTLMVTKVNAGPVEDFNRANPASEVAPGDRIEAVNGAEGDTQSMLDACKTATTLNMRVRRCEERIITLRRGEGTMGPGLSCQIVDGMTLLVTKVDLEGPASDHNRAHPDHDIDREDRVIGVNGVRSNAARLEEAIRDADAWELVIRRIWPDEDEE